MIVTNLGFAAYLMLNGYELTGTPNRDSKDGKFLFPIEIEPEKHDELLRKYTVSEYCKFDGIIVHLKKMLPRY